MRPELCGKCYFCKNQKCHPKIHETFFAVSGRLRKAESLDPKDLILLEACDLCGHIREKVK